MKLKDFVKSEYNSLKSDSNRLFNFALIYATIVIFVYCYFGSYSFFENTFGNVTNLAYWKIIYHNFMAFVLFFCFGILFTKLFAKTKFSDVGFKFGNKKLGLLICLIATPVALLCGLSCVLDGGMTAMYPLVDFASLNWIEIVLYFVSYFCYYIGWEYLFRGLMFFGTKQKVGVLPAILISTMISALIHTSIAGFGKPMIETLSAIPAGLIFAYIDYKTDSIFTSLYIHTMIGFSTDMFIFLLT